MGSTTGGEDIVRFAQHFLARLETVPAAYERGYNAPHRRAEDSSLATARRPAVNIVEVTLKSLYGRPATATVRLSRHEASLIKVYREAASVLGCDVDNVLLVQDGQVLRETHVSKVVSGASGPVYIFDRRLVDGGQGGMPVASPPSAPREAELRKDLGQLLLRHFAPPQAAMLASRFMEEYAAWMES